MNAGQIALYAFAASGAVAWTLILSVLIAWLQIKPWSPENRDHSVAVARLPFPLFAFGCWYRRFGAWLVNQVPSPMLAVDMASVFLKSQVRGAPAQRCSAAVHYATVRAHAREIRFSHDNNSARHACLTWH